MNSKIFLLCVFLGLSSGGLVLGDDSVFTAAWTNCAEYKQDCKCVPEPDTVCLVRFGYGDNWVFKQIQGFDIPCTHDAFGFESKRKEDKLFNCFNTTVPASQAGGPFTTVADHGKHFTLAEFALIRYGIEKKNIWAYGILANGTFSCEDGLLGFFPGGHHLDAKVCQAGHTFLSQNQTFSPPLADPNKNFTLLQADAIYSVYYGSYVAQIASSSPMVCNAADFGLAAGLLDRNPPSCGVLSGTPVEFYNPVGFWENVESCDGTESCSFTISEGVTSSTTSSRSTTWQVSLSGTVKGGMTFKGGDVGGSLTPSVSASINLMQSSTYGMSLTKSCAASCKVPAGQIIILWQWQMTTTEINFNAQNLPLISDQFQTFVCNYLCLPQGVSPQCPPGYCSDSSCQTCTGPIFAQ